RPATAPRGGSGPGMNDARCTFRRVAGHERCSWAGSVCGVQERAFVATTGWSRAGCAPTMPFSHEVRMPKDDAAPAAVARLLDDDEPAPCSVLNGASTYPVLLVCDHASRRLPRALGDLGLDPVARQSHLAWDIGAGELTRRLAASLGATAV